MTYGMSRFSRYSVGAITAWDTPLSARPLTSVAAAPPVSGSMGAPLVENTTRAGRAARTAATMLCA